MCHYVLCRSIMLKSSESTKYLRINTKRLFNFSKYFVFAAELSSGRIISLSFSQTLNGAWLAFDKRTRNNNMADLWGYRLSKRLKTAEQVGNTQAKSRVWIFPRRRLSMRSWAKAGGRLGEDWAKAGGSWTSNPDI
jgi:hypothetical protein